uniref:Sodium/potassium/calcium exchanger n=1 Tax=Eptatretus cirrhatus TaxID=78394 RepID=A0A3P8MY41_9VERT|nr:Sodium/potassium/calcium exchanger [Eptatretus cirrhatus]
MTVGALPAVGFAVAAPRTAGMRQSNGKVRAPLRRLHPLRFFSLGLVLLGISALSILHSGNSYTRKKPALQLRTTGGTPGVAHGELVGKPSDAESTRARRHLMSTILAERSQNYSNIHSGSSVNKTEGNVEKGVYPQDIFSLEQRRHGAVLLHMLGMVYMFIGLALVCDEFFVPALAVIIEKLAISEDVAGATFMAAGGSAPELFTSLIGVFISHSNVGIGTIVGSAVFNILFVIGMCAIFSREILLLTWWPLFRDVSFYILGLSMLILFFLDNRIDWWESLLLLTTYGSYVLFMKYNVPIETWVKRRFLHISTGDEGDKVSGSSSDPLQVEQSDDRRIKGSKSQKRQGKSASTKMMRNSLFQLMIYTLDPLGEEIRGAGSNQKFYDSIINEARLQDKLTSTEMKTTPTEGDDSSSTHTASASGSVTAASETAVLEAGGLTCEENGHSTPAPKPNGDLTIACTSQNGQQPAMEQDAERDDKDDQERPLSLSWPETAKKRTSYLVLLPLVLPLWFTLPDVRKPSSRKFFIISFFGSIAWIGGFSYLMVWWAHQVGETMGITEEIMGLTILAAGTSIPDLITSVIVARKGLGDMAVSSSVGSNIFDITVGLPFPWLLHSMMHAMAPVKVSSNGLFCAIVLLFLMLLFVIITIAACHWRMNKLLGCTMFVLYLFFLVTSVLLEKRIMLCPVTV